MVRGSARRWARAAGQRRDGCGRRRGGGAGPSLLLQGGAARGRLRGEDVAGAALLREQVQRQAHHHPAGADPGETGWGPAPVTPSPHAFPLPFAIALGTRGPRQSVDVKTRSGEGKDPEKSPVAGGGCAGRGVPQSVGWFSPLVGFCWGTRCFHSLVFEHQPFFFPCEAGSSMRIRICERGGL